MSPKLDTGVSIGIGIALLEWVWRSSRDSDILKNRSNVLVTFRQKLLTTRTKDVVFNFIMYEQAPRPVFTMSLLVISATELRFEINREGLWNQLPHAVCELRRGMCVGLVSRERRRDGITVYIGRLLCWVRFYHIPCISCRKNIRLHRRSYDRVRFWTIWLWLWL